MDPEVKKMWKISGFTGAIGLEIAIAIAIGYFGGGWLDRRLGTTPWLTWIGFAAGIGASIKALVRVVREYKRDYPDEPLDDGQPNQPTDGPSGGQPPAP